MHDTTRHDQLSDHAPAVRLHPGQSWTGDLSAGTSIITLEGEIQVAFRDHSLAWLGDAMPIVYVTVYEGCRYVTERRGVVSVQTASGRKALFAMTSEKAVGTLKVRTRPAIRENLLAWLRSRFYREIL